MFTETWHKSSDNICLSLAKPRDFSFLEQVRLNDPGHGVTYFRNHFKCVKIPLPVIITFEAICFKLTLRKTLVIFLVIYRPGSAPPAKLFFEELILVLEQITLLCCSIVVAGNFNIHVETSSDIYATALADIFSSFDLVNRINQPTHVLGGTLDLIVTSDGFLLEDILVYPSGIYSDHGLVTGQFLINPTPVIFKKSWIRSWKRVDKKRLTELLRCSPISKHYGKEISVENEVGSMHNADDFKKFFADKLKVTKKNFSAIPPCVYTDVLKTPYKTHSTSFDNEKPLGSKVCPCSNLQCSPATPTFPTSTSFSNKHDSLPSLNVVSSSAPSSDVSQTQTLVPPSSPSFSRELGVGLSVGLSLLVIVLVAVALLFYLKRIRPLKKSKENHISHVYVGETESKV
ncbi:hypothetical protein HELRODRAFT_173108 [Helobdella robusta]|uniref:Endonuclease/exonuclease/phosphatase domain-containing protein n=1 Tax=Helobdella robusta TaxID=6412 RepID=T1F6D2_HELRO|nr:hypothetical protein HELRODRAFT_173108 [Helobdella robusta]ESO04037.1 hypothetical protein HELRODRAFT_173108 [Helobdella robusta]